MKAEIVGQLIEHSNGIIDLFGWVLDCDCCANIEQAIQTHRQELIKLAKEAGRYSLQET